MVTSQDQAIDAEDHGPVARFGALASFVDNAELEGPIAEDFWIVVGRRTDDTCAIEFGVDDLLFEEFGIGP